MMRINVAIKASPAGCSLHGCLLAARGTAPGLADSRALGIATLVSWLITEGLGAYMLGTWIAADGPRQQRARPGGLPPPVIFGHAGLAFTGFAGWVSYLVTGSPALAWLAVGFLIPAVGLGISTVTLWTPYPARRGGAGAKTPAGRCGNGPDGQGTGGEGPGKEIADDGPGDHRAGTGAAASPTEHAHRDDALAGMLTDEMLARALRDEVLTSRLVNDLLASMLAVHPPAARRPKWHLAPLIPAAHGLTAMATIVLAVLAATAAT
jgi:hypothetical protein